LSRYLRRILVPVFFLTALAVCAPRAEAREGSRAEAERLWEMAVAAKGGRERLHAVHSILETATWSKYRLVSLYAFPGMVWSWDYEPEPFGFTSEMMNAECRIGYVANSDDPKSPHALGGDFPGTARYVNDEEQMYYLLETRWLKPEPFEAAAGEVGGRRADVVRAHVSGRQADFFFDRKTHLPLKIVFPSTNGEGPSVMLKDYAEVGGVMLPSKVSHKRDHYLTYSFILNPDYDERVFERAPTIEAGPDAWKRRGGRELKF
jgi:hypothetical protein